MRDTKWAVVGRMKAGWFADGGGDEHNRVSSSGGQLEPYQYWTGEQCSGYAAEAQEGALVYDAEDADYDEITRVVIRGPMKDCSLAPFSVSPFDLEYPRTVVEIESVDEVTVESLAAMGVGSLGTVGLGIYEHLLRQIAGIKFGRIHEGKVVWENE